MRDSSKRNFPKALMRMAFPLPKGRHYLELTLNSNFSTVLVPVSESAHVRF